METALDHASVERALRLCGASWDAAQAHGLLSGRLAVHGPASGFDWLHQVLDGAEDAASKSRCEALLSELFETTHRQLSERLSEFEPLLPDDSDPAAARATALAHWCEGFLHGLVSAKHEEELRSRLAALPLSEIIADLLQITRAAVDAEADRETNETAYAELVEYLRVAAQLCYEELADLRAETIATDEPGLLH